MAPRKKKGRFDQEFNTFALDYFKGDVVHDFAITDRWSMSTRFFATNADRPRFTVDPEDILVDPLPAFVFDDPDDRFIEGVQGVMVSRDRHYRTYGIENRMELTDIKAAGLDHTLQWGTRFERHFLDDMHLSATVSYFGDFYTDPLNTRNLVLADEDRQPVEPGDTIEIREPAVLGRVKSHTLLSARLSYDIPARDMTVWLQGRNLTDRRYVTDLENGMRAGAERTVMGDVRIRF